MSEKVEELTTAIRNGIIGLSGFTSDNVIIGSLTNIDRRSYDDGDFPCASVAFLGSGGSGEYHSQRNINVKYRFEMIVHSWVATDDIARNDGTDMFTIVNYCSSILDILYGWNDAETKPCTGYQMTLPDFEEDIVYQYFKQNVNTGFLEVGFWVDSADTAL